MLILLAKIKENFIKKITELGYLFVKGKEKFPPSLVFPGK